MYVGHALVAALVCLALARLLDLERTRALLLAATAGVFGTLPDVDLAYTVYAVARKGPTGIFPTTEHVWTESWLVHRTLTHSLLVGAVVVATVAAVAVATRHPSTPPVATDWRVRDPRGSGGPAGTDRGSSTTTARSTPDHPTPARPEPDRQEDRPVPLVAIALLVVAALLAGGLGVLAYRADGGLGVVTMGLYVAGAVATSAVATRRGLPPALVVLAASVGIGLHPFGDLWMGRPPIALYPIGTEPLSAVRFAADPTLHFLSAVLVEVGLFAAVLLAGARTVGRSLAATVSPVALLGLGLVAAVAVVPAPTFEVAYQFSFAMVGLGALAGVATWLVGARRGRRSILPPAATAAVAMTLGVLAYAGAYVAIG